MGHAITSTGQTFNNNTLAGVRSFGLWIKTLFLASAWVQTADTGQADWVATPASWTPVANTAAGFNIFRMNDALAPTKPVFVKIESGVISNTSMVGIWVTVGTGSDGAGNITGIIFARAPTGFYPVQFLGSTATYVGSGDTDRIYMIFNAFTTSLNCHLSIERSKDANGANSGDGLLISAGISGQDNKMRMAFAAFTGSQPPLETDGTAMLPISGSSSYGANVGTWPIPYFNFGAKVNPGLNQLIYRTADISSQIPVLVTTYDGVAHTYLPLGHVYHSTTGQGIMAINRNSAGVMVRYE